MTRDELRSLAAAIAADAPLPSGGALDALRGAFSQPLTALHKQRLRAQRGRGRTAA